MLHNAGGRDIKAISSKAKEDEVTILPGSTYKVTSTKNLPDSSTGAVYEIHLNP